jgi:anti-sigma B factor antagonist
MPEIEKPAELRSTEFSVEQSTDVHGAVLTLSGELDLSSAPELEQAIREAKPAESGRRLLFDLSSLGFMDSTGVSVLIASKQNADADGWLIAIRRPNGQVRRLLELVGLLERLEVED